MGGNSVIEYAVIAPEFETTRRDSLDFDTWIVTVFDNDFNSVEEVLTILMAATNCSPSEAFEETWEIHNLGKSVVHHGAESECTTAAEIIAQIGIRVEVTQE